MIAELTHVTGRHLGREYHEFLLRRTAARSSKPLPKCHPFSRRRFSIIFAISRCRFTPRGLGRRPVAAAVFVAIARSFAAAATRFIRRLNVSERTSAMASSHFASLIAFIIILHTIAPIAQLLRL